MNRFGTLFETMEIKLGVSVADINFLDDITLPMVINGRTFSIYTDWIVVACDPGQDTLTLVSK
jgi:hypothetical protein